MKNGLDMVKLLFVFLLIPVSVLTGQSTDGILKNQGLALSDLKPSDYKYVNHAEGDLNGDGFKDLVFVIQGTDTTKIQYSAEFKVTMVDSNKRVLAIYFRDSTGLLHKQFENADFIQLKDDEYIEDPFNLLEITDKGVLKIGFGYWTSMGTWETSTEKYLFLFNKGINKFELIGYYYSWFMRNSFEGEEKSVNFPAGKMSIKINPMQDEKVKPVWKKFTLEKMKTLDEIAEPGLWQFEGMYL